MLIYLISFLDYYYYSNYYNSTDPQQDFSRAPIQHDGNNDDGGSNANCMDQLQLDYHPDVNGKIDDELGEQDNAIHNVEVS